MPDSYTYFIPVYFRLSDVVLLYIDPSLICVLDKNIYRILKYTKCM